MRRDSATEPTELYKPSDPVVQSLTAAGRSPGKAIPGTAEAMRGECGAPPSSAPRSPGQPSTLRHVLIAAISDTHLPRGRRRLPDACVERLKAADLILHAG